MNGGISQDIHIGETLPLFGAASSRIDGGQQLDPEAGPDRQATSLPAIPASPRPRGGRRGDTVYDRHMRAAWQLSNALEALKKGRKAGRRLAKMTPSQRHQVGNAICEHLLASLREQVESEEQVSRH